MKSLITIIIIIIVAILGFWYFSGQETSTNPTDDTATSDTQTGSQNPTPNSGNSTTNNNETDGTDAGMIDDGTIPSEAREFTIDGSNFKFAPNKITVQEGDLVRIIFKNTGGTHDFVIDEFDVATAQLPSGSQEIVEFVADRTGSFEFYCSVGSHRQMGMVGTLIVE